MPIIVLSPRGKLRNLLRKQSLSLTDDSPESVNLRNFLKGAEEGLVALNYGEVWPIFAPRSKADSKDGAKPYTLRKLRMKALGYANLLISNKYKGEATTIRTVAEAYGQKANTFRAWRKKLGKTADAVMKSFREEVANLDWNENHVLAISPPDRACRRLGVSSAERT
jgi:hypothetical protein